ncbi:MAG: hypothetical protein LBC86_03995 [Oscillospiraceae bacterium]|jgi:hypothetical protein|nr:hypothetical protein [Oscillospiraceae bacterium]
MPFNSETAANAGKKGGRSRWDGNIPDEKREKKLLVSLTQTEFDAVTDKAAALGLSKAELVIRAVKAYSEE